MDYGGIDWGIKNAFKEIKLLLLSLSGSVSLLDPKCVLLHSMITISVWIIQMFSILIVTNWNCHIKEWIRLTPLTFKF